MHHRSLFQIKELQSKLDKSQSRAVKLEMSASMFYRDGASDSDSSVVFNEESIDQQCFIDTYTANFPCKGFLEETFAIPSEEQELGAGTEFFSDEPVSDPSHWYGSDEWVDWELDKHALGCWSFSLKDTLALQCKKGRCRERMIVRGMGPAVFV